jgi:membrane protease YdiL (CAAX protease family)
MTNVTFLDHLFVFAVLVVIFPFVGWWAYRRFLARAERDPERALVREYKITILWLVGLGAATAAVWALAGRPWAALGLVPPLLGEEQGPVTGIVAGALVALAVRPLLAAVSAKARAGMVKQFGKLAIFLPKTGEQLVWGLAVSVAAGLFEEIAYRGYLIPYFQHWLPLWPAVAASAVLFGLAHLYQGVVGVIMTGVLGAAFGYILIETQSLALPVLLHILVDISAMVSAYFALSRRPLGVEAGEA